MLVFGFVRLGNLVITVSCPPYLAEPEISNTGNARLARRSFRERSACTYIRAAIGSGKTEKSHDDRSTMRFLRLAAKGVDSIYLDRLSIGEMEEEEA